VTGDDLDPANAGGLEGFDLVRENRTAPTSSSTWVGRPSAEAGGCRARRPGSRRGNRVGDGRRHCGPRQEDGRSPPAAGDAQKSILRQSPGSGKE
jgi:hypothetical protein